MIKVYIVDDHKMVIEGIQLLLKSIPNITLVGTALSGNEAINDIPTKDVDIVLLDINMPHINGVETCKTLLKNNPSLKVIALSMHKESSLIKLMLSSGAKGYILKNAGQQEIINAIQKVNDGERYLEATVNTIVINSILSNTKEKTNSPFPSLSKREKEILNLIVNEYTTQEIADKLIISFGTVETHRRNMLIKTGARNTAGLVRIALEYQLI